MGTTYGRSPGGYLWAILEPVAGIALLSTMIGAVVLANRRGRYGTADEGSAEPALDPDGIESS